MTTGIQLAVLSGICHRPAGLQRQEEGPAARARLPRSKGKSMTRTPEEVLQHHAKALRADDLDEIVADYAENALSSQATTWPRMTAANPTPATAGHRPVLRPDLTPFPARPTTSPCG